MNRGSLWPLEMLLSTTTGSWWVVAAVAISSKAKHNWMQNKQSKCMENNKKQNQNMNESMRYRLVPEVLVREWKGMEKCLVGIGEKGLKVKV